MQPVLRPINSRHEWKCFEVARLLAAEGRPFMPPSLANEDFIGQSLTGCGKTRGEALSAKDGSIKSYRHPPRRFFRVFASAVLKQ